MKRFRGISRKVSKLLLLKAVGFGLLSASVEGLAGETQADLDRDATGVSIGALSTTPSRIVTLAPSLAELCADLLGEDLTPIVGVSEYTDHPDLLKRRPSVGPYHQFNLEKVLALKPELVLATTDGNPKDSVLRLRELGVRVVVFDTESLQGVRKSALILGKLLGKPDAASAWVKTLDSRLSALRTRTQKDLGGATPSVLLQLGDDPLIVVGRRTFLNDALAAIGLRNAYGDLDARYPSPSVEDVVKRNPDALFILSMDGDTRVFDRAKARWLSLGSSLRAGASGKVRVLRADPLVRPTLRMVEGLALLVSQLSTTEGKKP